MVIVNKKIIVLIPARMGSTRLKDKILLDINGKTMIQRIYENVKNKTNFDVYVAAGDQIIVDEVEKFGGKAIITDRDLLSGSDRIAQALERIEEKNNIKYDIVVNFQGDAVNTRPEIINDLVDLLLNTDADITTPCMLMKKELHDESSSVKIATAFTEGKDTARALYFSRNRVPFDRDTEVLDIYHHIGIYVYKAQALKQFVKHPKGILETRECLEQLRALENGMTIWTKLVKNLKIIEAAPADIDLQDELDECRKYIKD